MTDTPETFLDGTMLSQLVMDIFANKETDDITILYDKPLSQELLGLEYSKATRDLLFIFDMGAVPFGMKITEEIHDYMTKSEAITLLHVDRTTNKAVSGMEVPLKFI